MTTNQGLLIHVKMEQSWGAGGDEGHGNGLKTYKDKFMERQLEPWAVWYPPWG